MDPWKLEVEKLEKSKTAKDDISRMELELSRMESALYESYCEVGKTILETAETEGRRINEMVDRIIETKKKLAAIREEKECPVCGACNEKDSPFCKRCGKKFADNGEEQKKWTRT